MAAMAAVALGASVALSSCSDDNDGPEITTGTVTDITPLAKVNLDAEFYLLNEGNMGANKCTLDFVDLDDMRYYRNIFAENNPNEVLELGDVGNDMAIHDDRVYIVVNGSHKIQVLDEDNARSVGKIDVNSPRNLAFDNRRNGYVTSFVGGLPKGDADGNVNGSLVRFDTRTLAVTGTVSLGGCPEGVAVVGNRAYVVNSGIYPNFENTVSVVDLDRFEVVGNIEVAPNMHHIVADRDGNLWINSRGDYLSVPSRLYRVKPGRDVASAQVTEIATAAANMTIAGNYVYVYSSEYNYTTGLSTNTYACVNRSDCSMVSNALTGALNAQTDIETPYGIWYDAEDNIMLLSDARNYTSSGTLLGYSMQGQLLFKATTGDIPGHIAFDD